MQFVSKSPEQTEQFAENFAKDIQQGVVIAFFGDLGAGKTAFIRGLVRGLGFDGEVFSPTFAIVNEYIGGRLDVYHFDMYRISGWEDLYTTGYFDAIESGGVVAVEWSENIETALPDDCIRVIINKGKSENERIITVSGGKA